MQTPIENKFLLKFSTYNTSSSLPPYHSSSTSLLMHIIPCPNTLHLVSPPSETYSFTQGCSSVNQSWREVMCFETSLFKSQTSFDSEFMSSLVYASITKALQSNSLFLFFFSVLSRLLDSFFFLRHFFAMWLFLYVTFLIIKTYYFLLLTLHFLLRCFLSLFGFHTNDHKSAAYLVYCFILPSSLMRR